jgi:copper resistance protein D
VANLLDIFGSLSVFLRALTLGFELLLVGGVVFQWAVVRRFPTSDGPNRVSRPISSLLQFAVIGLAVTQTTLLTANCLLLTDNTGLGLGDMFGATFVVAGITSIIACVLISISLVRGARNVLGQAVLTLVIILAIAATSHGWSRIDNRAVSIAFTLLHHIAVGSWIGALPYLLATLRLETDPDRLTAIARRFSKMAAVGVGIVVLTGVSLSLLYIDSLSGLYGTSYGAMIMAKLWLLTGVLAIGTANNLIIRRLAADPIPGIRRLRSLLEAEIGIGFTVILAASSLVSQPPAIDLPLDRVTRDDIVKRFTPRPPRLHSPPLESLSPSSKQLAKAESSKYRRAISYVPGVPVKKPSTPGDIAWSEYNHHWAGLAVLSIGVLAVMSRSGKFPWSRHWPLLFLGLAVFLFLRADPENWPLGPNGFWESFVESEVLQHRIFTLLIVGFAIFEWRVRNRRSTPKWMAYIFPLICAVGGAALLTHSHSLSNVKEATLIELSHIPLAILALFAGWSRWLELRMNVESSSFFSWIWPVCFVLIGVTLLLYRESSV